MIRLLKGIVEWVNTTHVLVDVQGVGYYVYASQDVLSQVDAVGIPIKLFTYTHVREDLLELYGFATIEDLELFEQLIGVSGVGPKTAIGIFSIGTRQKIMQAILGEDVSFFSRVPRLGKKNAQKIIIELKNKIGALEETIPGTTGLADGEVMSALKSFGFSTREITDAIEHIDKNAQTVSEKVRLALKYLGK